MPLSTAERLKKSIPKIMTLWEDRVNKEVSAASQQETVALRDSLPDYLEQLAEALSKTIDRTEARKIADRVEIKRLGKKHGKDRAESVNYTIGQLIFEYHILRQVVFDVLEVEHPLKPAEREVIVCSVEQAVNDAATEFSDTMKDLKEHMTEVLAHDLRNPLTTAKICTQLIMKKPDDKENCIKKANLILVNLERIDKMVSDLLDASKAKAGDKPGLEFKDCDLDWIVREVANESNIANEGRFTVKSTGKCIGLWSENGLRRLIENLVSNAVKYGLEGAPISISVEHDEKAATLSVHNEGKAIPEEERSLIFQKFGRAKSSASEVGWGLGLTFVQEMVESHKGTINVESEKDKGTTFIINIPKHTKRKSEIHEHSGPDVKARSNKKSKPESKHH